MFVELVMASICLNHIHKVSKAHKHIFVRIMIICHIFNKKPFSASYTLKQPHDLPNAHITYPLPESRGTESLQSKELRPEELVTPKPNIKTYHYPLLLIINLHTHLKTYILKPRKSYSHHIKFPKHIIQLSNTLCTQTIEKPIHKIYI